MRTHQTADPKRSRPLLFALFAVLATAVAVGATSANLGSIDPVAQDGPGRLVVSLDSPAEADRLVAAATRLGVSARSGAADSAIIDTRGSADALLVRMLAVAGTARAVEPAHRVSAAVVPSDPRYSSQWGLPAIGAPGAWDHTTGSADVVIAVVDTGVQLDHPDLIARVDTINDYDFVNLDSIANDDNGHGTHVAGIAAATMNNGTGGCGAAPDATILPLKVLDASGNGWDSDVADAIRYAADRGADVINVSLGGTDYSSYLAAAVAYARAAGSVVVAAGGNNNVNAAFYPAADPGALGVTAVDPTFARASFANWGAHIDIAAPGTMILSTTRGSGYGSMSGTSMAAPFVSGVAALMKSADPGSDATRIIDALQASAVDLGSAGRDDIFGYGLVDAHDAIVHVTDHAPPSTVATGIPSGWSRGPVQATLVANDAASGVASTRVSTGTAGVPWTYVAPFMVSAEGTTPLSFHSVDRAGNVEETRTAQVRIDDSAPLTTCDATSTYSGSAVIRLDANDPYTGVAGTTWYLDGVPGTSNPVTVTVPGDHELLYYSVDGIGNREETRSAHFAVTTPMTRYEQTDPRIAWGGSSWTTATGSVYSGNSMRYRRGADTSFTVAFDGTGIDWIALKSSAYGLAHVTIDGEAPVDVNLYSATGVYRAVAFSRSGLAAGPHTMRVEWLGIRGGPGGTGVNDLVNLDAVDVAGTLTDAVAHPMTRYEQTDPRIAWGGSSWTTATGSVYSGNSMRYRRGADTSFTVAFDGTGIDWIALKSSAYGLAHVTIDGEAPVDVNLYSATGVYRAVAFSRSGLAAGPHTMRVEWLGIRGGPGGTGVNDLVNLDAVDVAGTLTDAVAHPMTRYEQTDPRIAWGGSSWTTATGSVYSGNSMRYRRGADTSFTVAFDGTGIDWIALKSSAYGLAHVTIDGEAPVDVNLYSATGVYRAVAFSRSGLAAGPHTMRVEWLGIRGGPGGTGVNDLVNLDAVDVAGTLNGP